MALPTPQLIDKNYCHQFNVAVQDMALPKKFTFPFFYQPHQLAIIASELLQEWLETQGQQLQNFAIDGKMFGVLVVQDKHKKLSYLAAYSGKTLAINTSGHQFCDCANANDLLDEFVTSEQLLINYINDHIARLLENPQIKQLVDEIEQLKCSGEQAIVKQQQAMVITRKQRKISREQACQTLTNDQRQQLERKLSAQSIAEKNTLRDLKIASINALAVKTATLNTFNDEIETLKKERKERSNDLQQHIFSQYKLLNSDGNVKDLNEIFSQTAHQIPPSGAGDCAAPKLLQQAYNLGLSPIALAEFWWGAAPASQVRQHKQYYPACIGKCQPILTHMLQGLNVDDNPLLDNKASHKNLDIVYQEASFLVINKPAGLLSVPGKTISDSVKTRIQAQFPDARGGIIVHRLDMATSGLMLIALTSRANKNLQHQFIKRMVEKRYVAIVDGIVEQENGVIELPLVGDFDDRPRQMVCEKTGKVAYTSWQIIKREQGKTWLALSPKTGRTHQLRVHCAHHLGLNCAMVGDDLYGKSAERLMLHAKTISFNHPMTKAPLVFDSIAPF